MHVDLWAMQHDGRWWQDPETFKPERWVGDKTGGDRSGGLAYMPFGAGPRMCIGIKLARECPTLSCPALPCAALPCCAVLCCAVLFVLLSSTLPCSLQDTGQSVLT